MFMESYLKLTTAENAVYHQQLQSITPQEKERRGSQLSIRVLQTGRALCDGLSAEGILGDWREPDTFRVAPVPLYNSYHDVFQFVQRFKAAVR